MPAYKDNNGTWFCKFYYTDYNGVKKQKKKRGFKTQREAKAWERNFLETKALDVNIKFENFVEVYIEDIKTRLKPSTFHGKYHRIQKHILPYFKDMTLSEIKPMHIRKWHAEVLEYKCKNNEPLAESSKRSIHACLSSIFNYAVKYYDLKENPCHKAGTIGKIEKSVNFWTHEEFKQFISIVPQENRYFVLFNLLYYTGLRIGELLALTWGDIDLDNKIIHITKSTQRIKGQNIVTTPKTAKGIRDVVMFDYLADILSKYKRGIYKPQNNDKLFELTKTAARSMLKKHAAAAGVKAIRMHDLRHSHASLLIEMGIPPLLIAERLGHENVQTTLNVYSHLYPNKQNELADKLQLLVSDAVPK